MAEWIETGGGPLVVVEVTSAHEWTGVEGDDYGSACEVSGLAGVVRFGDGGQRQALVLADEALPTMFLSNENAFVQWMCASDEDHLIDAVRRLVQSVDGWELGGLIEVKGPLVLFDSVVPGSDISESLTVAVASGAYRILSIDLVVDAATSARIHRLELEAADQ